RRLALPVDREGDLRAGRAPDEGPRLVRRLAVERLAIHGGDDIAGLDPARLGRRALERGDDDEPAFGPERVAVDRVALRIDGADLDPDPLELPRDVLQRALVVLG